MTTAQSASLQSIWAARESTEGDAARVRRLFPGPARRNLDPFVLLDEFFVAAPAGFPTHPHRGFEAITYMLDGAFEHRDNLGNHSVVETGGAQRFNAGRGLEHSEQPQQPGVNRGLQLWINLPRRLKGMEPGYQEVQAEAIPEQTEEDGVVTRTVVGPGSPLELQTDVRYLHIRMPAGAERTWTVPEGHHGLLYLIAGTGRLAGQALDESHAGELVGGDVTFEAGDAPVELILLSGRPHGEPIRQWGPFVD